MSEQRGAATWTEVDEQRWRERARAALPDVGELTDHWIATESSSRRQARASMADRAEQQIAGGIETALIVLRQGGVFHDAINAAMARVLGTEPS